ncbi:response regulator [Silvanigrella aquatica]|uniref:response regulator n=1 Tax=Silvanigrella aquatica TaxID=1915309 RepID=UPI000B00EE94|nr:response regulator [Silvanigrella aquatica]
MKILVVDDSKPIHSLLEEMLESYNIVFHHVFNGQEAVNTIQDEKFDVDVILLDWEMPQLTGIEALPLLKKLRPDQIILMMTSKNSMLDIVEAIQKGAKDYIMKPFTKDILIGKITAAIGKDF